MVLPSFPNLLLQTLVHILSGRLFIKDKSSCISGWSWTCHPTKHDHEPWHDLDCLLPPHQHWEFTGIQHYTSLMPCCGSRPGLYANKNLYFLLPGYQGTKTSRISRYSHSFSQMYQSHFCSVTPLFWGKDEGKAKGRWGIYSGSFI